jgi:hypothetical protein
MNCGGIKQLLLAAEYAEDAEKEKRIWKSGD